MKHLYVLILLISFSFANAQSSGKIIYRIKSEALKPKNEYSSAAMKHVIKMLNSTSRIRDSLFFNLDFNKNESLFYLDKNKNVGVSNEKGYEAILKSFNSRYYRNAKNHLLIEEDISEARYLITSSTNDYNWTITNEKKKIRDYDCYKAIVKIKDKSMTKGNYIKSIVAWYCPELAINLGPKNYGGLPGLILELIDGKLTYYLYSINLDKNPIIEKPTKGKVITRDKYNSMIPHINKDNIAEYIGG